MNHEYKYIAFISYKREDEKWAKWLQHKLEHYKLPTSIRKTNPAIPERVHPVFKDTTDLAGGVLEKAIKEALQSSKYLIVICSPRAAQSPWVCKEVQEFIDSSREEYIIPFIIDGEPNSSNIATECFPKNLKELTGSRELLGININENGRDAAVVKVIARMFNLRFDMLWQRFQREERKHRRLVFMSLVIAFLFIAGVAIWIGAQNRIIHKQNIELELKNESILNANKALECANDSINKAYTRLRVSENNLEKSNNELKKSNDHLAVERDKVLRVNRELKFSNAKIISENAISSLKEGNLLKAKKMLKQTSSDELAIKLIELPEVESAFRKIYREMTREGFKHSFTLENIGDVSFAEFDESGNELFVGINNSFVLKVETSSGSFCEIGHIDDNVEFYAFDYKKGDLYYLTFDNEICIVNVYSKANSPHILTTPNDEVDDVIVSPNFDCLIYCTRDNISRSDIKWYVIDLKNDVLSSKIIPNCNEIYSYSSDGSKLIAKIKNQYCIYNIKDMIVESVIPYDQDICSANFTDDSSNIIFESQKDTIDIYNVVWGKFVQSYNEITIPYLHCSKTNPQYNRIIIGDIDGKLIVHNIDYLAYYSIFNDELKKTGFGDEIIVKGNVEEKLITNTGPIQLINFNKSGSKMVVAFDGKLCVWDVVIYDGLYKYYNEFDFVSSSGKSYIRESDGYAQLYDISTKNPIGNPLFKQNSGFEIKLISDNNKSVVTVKDSLIYVFNPMLNKYFTIPYNCYDYLLKLSMDRNGDRLAVWDSFNGNKGPSSLSIYDLNTATRISTYNDDLAVIAMSISPNGKEIVVCTGYGVYIYDTETFTKKLCLPNDQGTLNSITYSSDGKYIIATSRNRTICMWDTYTGALKKLSGVDCQLKKCGISADNKYIIASSYTSDEGVTNYVWNVETEKIVDKFTGDFSYSFCNNIVDKIYSSKDVCDFPSKEELIDFFNKNNHLESQPQSM